MRETAVPGKPAIPEGLLCRIIVAMAGKVRKDLEKGEYNKTYMHTFLNLLNQNQARSQFRRS